MLEDMHRLAAEHALDLVVAGFYIDTYYGDDKFYRELRTAPDAVSYTHLCQAKKPSAPKSRTNNTITAMSILRIRRDLR